MVPALCPGAMREVCDSGEQVSYMGTVHTYTAPVL